ncbi:MAG TPA: hypothetical protein VIM07_15445 [Chitinophagaceae bacterium]
MKLKILYAILLLLATFASKANYFNYSVNPYSKIAATSTDLNQAQWVEGTKPRAIKIYKLVFRNFNDTCPPPTKSDYLVLCAYVATAVKAPANEKQYYEYYYEKKLWEMAGIKIGVDNEETVKKKLQLFWNKYKTSCKCDALNFGLPNGNLLKYALSQNMPGLIETLADTYMLDINFIDPADGLNLLDYIIGEVERLKRNTNSAASVKVYEDYKAAVIGLGGKSNRK